MKHINKKTKRMLQYEAERGMPIEEILRRMYVDDNLSMMQISKQLNLSYPEVNKWIKQAGIYSHKLQLD